MIRMAPERAITVGVDLGERGLRVEAFDGIGLRPYPVAHLRSSLVSGDVTCFWTRRTRVDGDSWQSAEVPLGETTEAYSVRIIQGPTILAEYAVSQPSFT